MYTRTNTQQVGKMVAKPPRGMQVSTLMILMLFMLSLCNHASGIIVPNRTVMRDVVIHQDVSITTNTSTTAPSINTTSGLNTTTVPLNTTTAANSFNITANTTTKPTTQEAGMSLHEMSIVLSKENLSQNLSDAIVICLSNRTWTSPSWWGLYNTSQFSHTLIQAEYYAYCVATTGLQFRINITDYMKGAQLADCVRLVYPNFSTSASIVYARKVIESLPNGTHATGGLPAWIIGIVVGVLILVSCVISVIIMFKKTRFYDPILFELDEEVESNPETRRLREQQQLDAHINAIKPGYQ